jgi:Uma2 family endonuclease
MSTLRVADEAVLEAFLEERHRRGLDLYDEVWDGVYVMPSMPNLAHQDLVTNLTTLLSEVILRPRLGRVQPGANVSDRRRNWKENYRVPDVVVVLNGGRAIDCDTHWFGGPDFLVEVQSPGDDTEEKVPFYGEIQVRELLIIHRDQRTLRLLRHDGHELVPVEPSVVSGKRCLASEVLPLAFRRVRVEGQARTEVRRTDGEAGRWTV